MSSTTDSKVSGGIGFFGLLTILFVGLKLTGFITWSWWWVLSPIWMQIALFAVFFVVVYGALTVNDWLANRQLAAARKRNKEAQEALARARAEHAATLRQ